jgi:hypothetical protein
MAVCSLRWQFTYFFTFIVFVSTALCIFTQPLLHPTFSYQDFSNIINQKHCISTKFYAFIPKLRIYGISFHEEE